MSTTLCIENPLKGAVSSDNNLDMCRLDALGVAQKYRQRRADAPRVQDARQGSGRQARSSRREGAGAPQLPIPDPAPHQGHRHKERQARAVGGPSLPRSQRRAQAEQEDTTPKK